MFASHNDHPIDTLNRVTNILEFLDDFHGQAQGSGITLSPKGRDGFSAILSALSKTVSHVAQSLAEKPGFHACIPKRDDQTIDT